MRRFVLWFTGRDFFEPTLPSPPYIIAGYNHNWRVVMIPNDGLVLCCPVAPFFLHRWAQWLVLGFKWELLK